MYMFILSQILHLGSLYLVRSIAVYGSELQTFWEMIQETITGFKYIVLEKNGRLIMLGESKTVYNCSLVKAYRKVSERTGSDD